LENFLLFKVGPLDHTVVTLGIHARVLTACLTPIVVPCTHYESHAPSSYMFRQPLQTILTFPKTLYSLNPLLPHLKHSNLAIPYYPYRLLTQSEHIPEGCQVGLPHLWHFFDFFFDVLTIGLRYHLLPSLLATGTDT
jgi:hypothetical protein